MGLSFFLYVPYFLSFCHSSMSLCKASAFVRLVVNPFKRTMLLVNKVKTPKIPWEVGRNTGDLCALSKAGIIRFETISV